MRRRPGSGWRGRVAAARLGGLGKRLPEASSPRASTLWARPGEAARRRIERRRRTCASQSLRALAAMVSKTGWTSVGELEMTRRISPVAVCCSSVSVRSRLRASSSCEEADVLDGDDGLVGEGLQERDLPVGERAHLGPPDRDAPIGSPSRRSGVARMVRCASSIAPRESGYSRTPRSAARSSTWIDAPVARARPTTEPGGRSQFPPEGGNPPCGRDDVERSPSRRPRRSVTAASQSRAALCAIVSKTGWTSVGELLMTRRISLVAVCCSRVSVRSRFRASNSWKSRTFSTAMTA